MFINTLTLMKYLLKEKKILYKIRNVVLSREASLGAKDLGHEKE